MSTSTVAVERFGLTEVYTCNDPAADVVFVHGLNGDPERTWTSANTKVFWPRDLLPNSFDPDFPARVLVYGYDADVTASAHDGGTTKDRIHNHAELLVEYLVAVRGRQRHVERRPIIFVAHSLGGLVVKRALIYSASFAVGSRQERLRSVFLSTYSIIFMGTPHHGSDLAVWGSYLERLAGSILPKKVLDTQSQLVEALKADSETLVNIERGFVNLQSDLDIFYLHEAKKTDVKGTLKFVVDEQSAAPAQPDVRRAGIQADHSHMCKFDGATSPGYMIVGNAIASYIRDVTLNHDVAKVWYFEQEAIQLKRGERPTVQLPSSHLPEISEPASRQSSPSQREIESNTAVRLLDYQPTGPDPYFFVPPGFRANAYFVGMDKQLSAIHDKLFDPDRRNTGTTSVVIHGRAGSGKSHLARQYLYKHKHDFKGGIFWIHARHFDEIEKDMWKIAQRYVASDSPEIHIEPSGRAKNYIEAVKEWFSSRDQWLIILDGITIETRQDAERLQQMIPDAADTSLIYTSRSSQFHVSHRLMHPQPVKVPTLPVKDATDLLFEETNIQRSQSKEKAAEDIVKKVGGLPLAIHAISVRLVETREPLEQYRLRSYADDQKLGGPYHEILEELYLHHRAAYNLMNILAFFGARIPVELIRMGVKALRSTGLIIKTALGHNATPEINNSLSILMRHALVERNEVEDSDSSASSKSSLLESEPEPEPTDMLRLHSVIQKFCRDRLDRGRDPEATLSQWVDRASKVLIQSYGTAKERIERQGSQHHPRVSDLQEYLTHARRMREFSIEYEHKTQPMNQMRARLDEILSEITADIEENEQRSSRTSVIVQDYIPSIFDKSSITSSSSQMSQDEPITPKPRPGNQPSWITDWEDSADQTLVTSPVDRAKPSSKDLQVEQNGRGDGRTALEMLRSLSDRTIRPVMAISDDIAAPVPVSHVRALSQSSQPRFSTPLGPAATVGVPDLGIHARGEFSKASSVSGSPQGPSNLFPQLSQTQSKNNPTQSTPQPLQLQDQNALPQDIPAGFSAQSPRSPTGRSPYGTPLARIPSGGVPAPPMLTQGGPNPRATPFYPSAYMPSGMIPTLSQSGYQPAVMPSSLAGPAFAAYWPQQVAGVPVVYNQAQYGVGHPVNPTLVPLMQSPAPALFNPVAGQLGGRFQAYPPAPYGLAPAQMGQDPRHVRAASVPNIDSQPPDLKMDDSAQHASAMSSPGNWNTGYSPPQMGREASNQSNSSGISLRPPLSAPQYSLPFTTPAHPLAQVMAPTSESSGFTSPQDPTDAVRRMSSPGGIILPSQVVPMSTQQFSSTMNPPIMPGMYPSPSPHPASVFAQPPLPYQSLNTPHTSEPIPGVNTTSSSTPATGQPMSRNSSGPGILNDTQGQGLGITEFGTTGNNNATDTSSVTFGDHPAVDIQQARRRSEQYERRIQREQQAAAAATQGDSFMSRQPRARDINSRTTNAGPDWGAQSEATMPPPHLSGSMAASWDTLAASLPTVDYNSSSMSGSAPYPDINRMPADTDADRLHAMLQEQESVPVDQRKPAQSQDSPFTAREEQMQQRRRQQQQSPSARVQNKTRVVRGQSEPQRPPWLRP